VSSILRVLVCALLLGSTTLAQTPRRNARAPGDAGSRTAVLDAPVTRFVALGDTGEGNAAQFQVAAALGVVSQTLGTDFALLLGDNFYDTGVDSPLDPQFQTKFVQPYGALAFPFRPILGNHDYGPALTPDFTKGAHQVAYSALDPQWVMPATHFSFGTETAFFVGLDTHRIFHSGADVQSFFDDLIIGQFDLYICAHDHSLQDLVEAGGTSYLVSGAGATTTTLPGSNLTYFQAATEGFFHLEARPRTLVIRAYDSQGKLLHYRVLRK